MGIEPKMTLKMRKLLILLNAKIAKNTESVQAGYTAGTRQPGIFEAAGIRAASCGPTSTAAADSLNAATRRTESGSSREFRRFWCRMIPCAAPGGSSSKSHAYVGPPGAVVFPFPSYVSLVI